MGEHLHGFLVGQKILQVVLDEDAHPLLGIVHPFQALTQALQNGGERVFLDQIKQLFLRIKVVVQPGQGHAAGARKVAHGSAFVALLAEHLGSMLQDLGQTAVETAALPGWNPGRAAGKRTGTSRGSHAELEPPPLGVYRTFVLYIILKVPAQRKLPRPYKPSTGRRHAEGLQARSISRAVPRSVTATGPAEPALQSCQSTA